MVNKDKGKLKAIENTSGSKTKRVFLIRSLNEDFESSYREIEEGGLTDNAIISNLLSIIGEDIVILNEDKYIPTFEKMLNLMMPVEERKIKARY